MVLKNLFYANRNKSADHSEMTVEIKIIGLIHGQYSNVIADITLPSGALIKDLIKAAFEQGRIEKNVFRFVKGIRPPLSLMINGENMTESKKLKIKLNDGDKVTIFTPLSGG